MTDDQMDELLIQGARDYNEPGAVPRDEMWARIAEARRAAQKAEQPRSAMPRRWVWVGGALAAGLVLAVGIAIGRGLERGAPKGVSPIAVAPVMVTAKPDSTGIPTPARTTTVATNPDSIIPQLRQETSKIGRRVRELATADAPAGSNGQDATPNLAYRLVMLQHLTGSEAMITAFRASARRGEVDAQIASWSRELLSTTRMLEASPVTQDPTMKRLLEDLDLVIVQIAQYVTRGTTNSEELDLIERSIDKRGVMSKLRSTYPVRTAPAGT